MKMPVVFKILGMKYTGNQSVVEDIMPDDSVLLIPEPENPHDENAIRVELNGVKIGYVARSDAQHILPLMETRLDAKVCFPIYKDCIYGYSEIEIDG